MPSLVQFYKFYKIINVVIIINIFLESYFIQIFRFVQNIPKLNVLNSFIAIITSLSAFILNPCASQFFLGLRGLVIYLFYWCFKDLAFGLIYQWYVFSMFWLNNFCILFLVQSWHFTWILSSCLYSTSNKSYKLKSILFINAYFPMKEILLIDNFMWILFI